MVDDEHLERILNRVHEWVRAADTKAEILGLMQTATAALLADDVPRWLAPTASGGLKFGVLLAVVLWLLSLLMTAFTVLAVTDHLHQQSITFFGDITKWKALDKYREAVNTIDDTALRNDYICQIYISSIICGDKHWYLKRGIWLYVSSVVVLEVSLVLSGLKSGR
jgi:hypothetical protein